MPRKLSILILAIVGLHIVEVFALGKSATGALFGNLLQTVACFTAAAMCVGASRRGDGFARSFWLLVGAGIGVWGFANLGWTYYEVIQHREPPDLSFVRFLFDAQEAFFAMAILLDQDQDSHQLDFAFVLDATQIVLVCLFIYVGLYYVPSLSLDSHGALVREYTIATAQVLAIFALSLLRTWLTPLKSTRQPSTICVASRTRISLTSHSSWMPRRSCWFVCLSMWASTMCRRYRWIRTARSSANTP